jgi:hypothetical protein
MFASVRCYFVHKATAHELAARVGEDFADRLSARPGFVAYAFLDCGHGEAISISVFREPEQARASQTLARRWTEQHLTDMELTITESLHGQVMATRGSGHAGWAALSRHTESPDVVADGLARGEGFVACRVIEVGDPALLAVTLLDAPAEGDVGAGEVVVSREAGVLT